LGGIGQAATFDNQINSPSTSNFNLPTGTDSSTAFLSGAKISTDSTNSIIFDTAAQTVADGLGVATIVANSTGNAGLYAAPTFFSNNVNGTTRTRLHLSFYNEDLTAFAINTTNIASSKRIDTHLLITLKA
jgi:hypothetical protein